jgi:histidine kinase/DNA gyrase B/HSP90-like ATPase
MDTYTALSNTPEYLDLKRLAADGQLVLVGERYLPGGVVEAAFSDAAQANPEVGFDPQYFSNVTRDYRNWRLKWWREAVQNSVDAGARNVELNTLQDDETGDWRVGVLDDGRGMDAETITEKFLKMGGTGKADRTGQVGGFGEAKKLLAFPWIDWFLHTRNIHVNGQGSHYEIKEVGDHLAGTELIVTMPDDLTTTADAAMEFLQRSRIPGVKFHVNGRPFKTGGLRRGKLVREYDFGQLYRNKSSKTGKLYVRANGLYMFTANTFDAKFGTLLLELTGDTTKLLMSNREKFHDWRPERALDEFIAEIYTEGERALKKKEKLITETWKGTGRISTDQGVSDVLDKVGPLPQTDARGLIVTKESAKEMGASLEELVEVLRVTKGNLTLSPATPQVVEQITHEPLKGAKNLEALAQQLVWTPDWMLHNEVPRLSIPAKFRPEGMTGRIVALAQVWAEACRWVLIQLGHRAEYGVGFVFDTDALAMCMSRQDGYWLLLNPMRTLAPLAERKIPASYILKKSDRDDMKALYARAVHEVTHMDSGFFRHDASFSSALTENFAKCADGFKVMWKISKGIKAPKVPKAPKRKARPKFVRPLVRIGATSPDEGITELLIHDSSGEAKAYGSELAGTALWADTVTLRSSEACNMVVNNYLDEEAMGMVFGGVEVYALLTTRLLADLHALQEVAGAYTADLAVIATRQVDGTVKVEIDQSGKWETQIYAAELSLRALREPHGVDLGPVFISESSADFDVLQLAMPSLADLNRRYTVGKLSASQLVAWFRAQLARRDEPFLEANVIEVVASAGPEDGLRLRDEAWASRDLASALTDTLFDENIVDMRDGLAIDRLVEVYLGHEANARVLQGLEHRFTMPRRLFADLLILQELGLFTGEVRVLGSQVHEGRTQLVFDMDDPATAIYVDELGLRLAEGDETGTLADRAINTPLALPVESAAFGELSELLLPDTVDPVAIVPASRWLAWVEQYNPAVDGYEYGAHSRQPGYGSVPDGHIAIGHNELFPFGTVTYPRRLTPEEQDHFSLSYIPTLDELEELAEQIAQDMSYPEEWLELLDEGNPNEARMMISRHLDASRMALPSDDYMLRQVATRVRRRLAAEDE